VFDRASLAAILAFGACSELKRSAVADAGVSNDAGLVDAAARDAPRDASRGSDSAEPPPDGAPGSRPVDDGAGSRPGDGAAGRGGNDAASLPGYVVIEPGRFEMGSPSGEAGRDPAELLHTVTITRRFYLKTTEVTQAEWQQVMGTNPSMFVSCGGSCPVENVSWLRAVAFANAVSAREGLPPCYIDPVDGGAYDSADVAAGRMPTWTDGVACRGYRLPTEAEWEYAARAGTTDAFYTGAISGGGCPARDQALDLAGWYCGNAGMTTHPVAQRSPSPWGLFDMLGNVREWVWDWIADYAPGAAVDPIGPAAGTYRVRRGGSWNVAASFCRAAGRGGADLVGEYSTQGVRLARTIP